MARTSTAERAESQRSHTFQVLWDLVRSLTFLGLGYVFLAVLGVLALIGTFVPLGFVLVLGTALLCATNLRLGLAIAMTTTLMIPAPLGLAIGPIQMSAGRFFGFAFIAGWLAARGTGEGRRASLRSPIDFAVVAMLGAMSVSLVANSPYLSGLGFADGVQRLLVFAIDHFAFFYAAMFVLERSRRGVEWFVSLLAVVFTVIAVLGIFEVFLGRNIFTLLAPVLPLDTAAYVQQLVEASVLERGDVTRIRATFQGPHAMATAMVVAIPLLLHFARTLRGGRAAAALGGAAASSIALLFTASRGGYLALLLALAVFAAASGGGRVKPSHLAVVALALASVVAVNPQLRTTMTRYFQGLQTLEERSVRSRVSDYDNVFDQAARTPVFGTGPATWSPDAIERRERVELDLSDPSTRVIDNYYLQTLAELGMLGILGLLALFGSALGIAVAGVRRARDPAARSRAAAVLAGLTAMSFMAAVYDIFSFVEPTRLFLVLTAVACTAIRPALGHATELPSEAT